MLAGEMNTNSVTPVESLCHSVSSRILERNGVDWIEFDFAHTESKERSSCVFMLHQQWPPLCSSDVTHCYHRGCGQEEKSHSVKRFSAEQAKKIRCRLLRLVDIKSQVAVCLNMNIKLVGFAWPEAIALAFTEHLEKPHAGFREDSLYEQLVNVSLLFSLFVHDVNFKC